MTRKIMELENDESTSWEYTPSSFQVHDGVYYALMYAYKDE